MFEGEEELSLHFEVAQAEQLKTVALGKCTLITGPCPDARCFFMNEYLVHYHSEGRTHDTEQVNSP